MSASFKSRSASEQITQTLNLLAAQLLATLHHEGKFTGRPLLKPEGAAEAQSTGLERYALNASNRRLLQAPFALRLNDWHLLTEMAMSTRRTIGQVASDVLASGLDLVDVFNQTQIERMESLSSSTAQPL